MGMEQKKCQVCEKEFEQYEVLYFDTEDIFYHAPCYGGSFSKLKGMAWIGDTVEMKMF